MASRARGVVTADWEDGHHSEYLLARLPCALEPELRGGPRFGLHTWGDLRRLCPCGEHEAA